jgi:hypothetical protein
MEATYLIEGYAKVNVNDLATSVIYQDIRDVPIPKTQTVSDNRCRRNASRIVQTHGEPRYRCLVLFGEVMSHYRFKLRPYLQKEFQERLHLSTTLTAHLFQFIANVTMLKVTWSISNRQGKYISNGYSDKNTYLGCARSNHVRRGVVLPTNSKTPA